MKVLLLAAIAVVLLGGCDVLAPLPAPTMEYGWDGSERIPSCTSVSGSAFIDGDTCSATLVTKAWPHYPCRWCVGQDGCKLRQDGAQVVCVASCDDWRCAESIGQVAP